MSLKQDDQGGCLSICHACQRPVANAREGHNGELYHNACWTAIRDL